jgi:tetratricopeptide (TPR) repeat protein
LLRHCYLFCFDLSSSKKSFEFVFHMKQACGLIVGFILTAGVSAAFGMGSAPVTETATKPVKSTVDANAVYNQGVALMHEKKYAEALVDFEKAVQAKPDFAQAHNNLAYCLRHQGPGKYNEALGHYNKAIKLNPNLSEAYEYRGVLYVKMNRPKDAEKDLAKLQQLDPKLAAKLEYAMKNNGQEKDGY